MPVGTLGTLGTLGTDEPPAGVVLLPGTEVGVPGTVVSEVGTLILVPDGLLLVLGVVVESGVLFICESPPAGIPVAGVVVPAPGVVVASMLPGFFLLVAVGFLVDFLALGFLVELGVVEGVVVVSLWEILET